VRIAPERIAAYISDYKIDYSLLDVWEPYHCETVPKVYPYHQLVNNFDTLRVPVLTAPYGYSNFEQRIFEFLAQLK
jgi:hypothetical protein